MSMYASPLTGRVMKKRTRDDAGPHTDAVAERCSDYFTLLMSPSGFGLRSLCTADVEKSRGDNTWNQLLD